MISVVVRNVEIREGEGKDSDFCMRGWGKLYSRLTVRGYWGYQDGVVR